MASPFIFHAVPSSVAEPGDFVVHLPAGIRSKQALFAELNRRLGPPHDLGFDWAALADCLRDLEWITEHTVAILHEDLPRLESEQETQAYLGVLAQCAVDWKPGEAHRLVVAFPERVHAQVATARRF